MITIEEYRVFEPLSLYIKWSCSLPNVVLFKVYRSTHPEDMQLLSQTIQNYYSDISLIKQGLIQDLYYKIEAYDINGDVIDEISNHFSSTELGNYYKYQKWFESNFLKATLSKAGGHKIAILQKRHSGEFCPKCSHKATGEPTSPRCPVCYGVGFIGGFYTPIVTRVLFGSTRYSSRDEGTDNHSQTEQAQMTAFAYPRLFKGDVVVQLDTLDRFVVLDPGTAPVMMNNKRTGCVTYTVEKLGSNNPAYLVPVAKMVTRVTTKTIDVVTDFLVNFKGIKMRPRYGAVSLVLWNESDVFEEVVLSAESLQSVTDELLTFSIPTEVASYSRVMYRLILNNEGFEGGF